MLILMNKKGSPQPIICIHGTYDERKKPPLSDSFYSIIMHKCIRNDIHGFLQYIKWDHSDDFFRKEIVTLVGPLTGKMSPIGLHIGIFLTLPQELDNKIKQDMPRTKKIPINGLNIIFNTNTRLRTLSPPQFFERWLYTKLYCLKV